MKYISIFLYPLLTSNSKKKITVAGEGDKDIEILILNVQEILYKCWIAKYNSLIHLYLVIPTFIIYFYNI